jgi:DNA repair protein RadA/Sms
MPVPLTAVADEAVVRFTSGIAEFDRVLGGGVVPGSLVLIGGDPGIGKSTLLLQVAQRIAAASRPVLYVSGEESLAQIRMRSLRLGIDSPHIHLSNEQNVEALTGYLQTLRPRVVVVDSIQTISSPGLSSVPGTVAQLRECAARIMEMAKRTNTAFFLVGHVTKEGVIAGPKVLEHLVDTVVYFEGEKAQGFRLLRAVKNRFGSTDEVGVLEMAAKGIVEVANPSEALLSGRQGQGTGTAVVVSYEGTRPLLVEVQSLVAPCTFGYPRRMVSGLDQNRLALLVAVLDRRGGLSLASSDVYVKVAGGFFLRDPAVDLGVAAAIASGLRDESVPADMVFIGEIGLTGEVRPVPAMEPRVREAMKLGFARAVVPVGARMDASVNREMGLVEVATLREMLEVIR